MIPGELAGGGIFFIADNHTIEQPFGHLVAGGAPFEQVVETRILLVIGVIYVINGFGVLSAF